MLLRDCSQGDSRRREDDQEEAKDEEERRRRGKRHTDAQTDGV